MIRVLLAAPQPDVRSALRLLLLDLSMELVGEAPDWPTILALTPEIQPDMLLVDWELVTLDSGNTLTQLREACPAAVVIVLISQLNAREQAALSVGADAFISKGEMPDRVAGRLRAAAELVLHRKNPIFIFFFISRTSAMVLDKGDKRCKPA